MRGTYKKHFKGLPIWLKIVIIIAAFYLAIKILQVTMPILIVLGIVALIWLVVRKRI